MRKLILIKHAAPEVVPGVPSEKWELSARGRAQCEPLSERLVAYAPQRIVSSTEPKAVQTAQIVAERLNVPHETGNDLFEHDRSNVPHMRSGEFISHVELFFREPDELVLGLETANEAEARFRAAIDDVLARHASGDVAIVSHGTVIALFLAREPRERFRLWRQLGLPSFAVVEVPGYKLLETFDRV
jgi:broad specificity phosphatase PhoE